MTHRYSTSRDRWFEPPVGAHTVADLDAIEAAETERDVRRRAEAPVGRVAGMIAVALLRSVVRGGGLLWAVVLAGCATTGATFRSGVGDAFPEHPPFYAGVSARVVASDTTRIGHLPVAYQRGATQPAMFDPAGGEGSAVDALLREMTAYVDSLGRAHGVTVRLVEGGRVSAVAHRATTTPPDVHFGCVTESGAAGDDCAKRDDGGALGRGRQPMRLAVGRPSREWTAWMRDVMRDVGVGRALVLTLEIGQHLPRQSGLRGDKEVELGTGHVVRLPWLTSLETPVSVLQLTGALVSPDGLAIRIGAEGIVARRTPLLVSALGAQELLSEKDIEQSRTLRRDDLPDRPLAWQVALRHLVAQLTGRPEIAP